MSEVETSVEPPEVDEGGGDEEVALIRVSVHEKDGTELAAQVIGPDDRDRDIAKALVLCLQGVASMRGPGLQVAIQQAMGELP